MTLEILHDRLYELLKMIDDICREEKVRYFLDGGTEIGAVREKDFIPWDDDLDIKVLREDYPAFKEAMLKHLPSNYRYVEPADLLPAFYDFIPRIIDTLQPLRAETDEDRFYGNVQNRVGVDIFIIDKAPDSTGARSLMMLKCKALYGMAMSKRYKIHSEKYSFSQKVVTGVLRFVGKGFSMKRILKIYEKEMRRYEQRVTGKRFVGNFPIQYLDFYEDSWYTDVAYGRIRDREFPLPIGYDAELTKIFGDYMKPPKDRSIYITHL